MNRVPVPICHGRNRLRGSGVGFMFDGESHGYAVLGAVIREAIEREGSNFTAKAIECQILDLYAKAHADYESNKAGAVGHVYEVALEGRTFLLADERVLSKLH